MEERIPFCFHASFFSLSFCFNVLIFDSIFFSDFETVSEAVDKGSVSNSKFLKKTEISAKKCYIPSNCI